MTGELTGAAVSRSEPSADRGGWLVALRMYLGVIFVGNLIWETAQLPLYTIWKTGTLREKVVAVVHCTGGDLLIAFSSLILVLVVIGHSRWPATNFRRVAALTVMVGLAYTIFSEWLNIVVRASWAYSELMPVIPWLGTGLSPFMEWLVLPLAGFWTVWRMVLPHGRTRHEAYEHWLLPRLLDFTMRQHRLLGYRRGVISLVRGAVLEIGVGWGLNLPYYRTMVVTRGTSTGSPPRTSYCGREGTR